MKKFCSLFLGLTFFLVTACSSNEKHGFKSVAVQEFANIIADTTTIILVDVRTAEEYGSGHIENALNIDVKQDDFEKNPPVLESKSRKILLPKKHLPTDLSPFTKPDRTSKRAKNVIFCLSCASSAMKNSRFRKKKKKSMEIQSKVCYNIK